VLQEPRVQLGDGLDCTKEKPTSVPTTREQSTLPFHPAVGRQGRWGTRQKVSVRNKLGSPSRPVRYLQLEDRLLGYLFLSHAQREAHDGRMALGSIRFPRAMASSAFGLGFEQRNSGEARFVVRTGTVPAYRNITVPGGN
jgi:hypothetical protein